MKEEENVSVVYFPHKTGRDSCARGLPRPCWSKSVVFMQELALLKGSHAVREQILSS